MVRVFPLSISLILLFASLCFLDRHQAAGAEAQFQDGLGGTLESAVIAHDDSLVELARRYDIGYNEITAANPGVDPFVPDAGTKIMVPTEWILPDVPKPEGIVVNLPEFRLYCFCSRSVGTVETYPIGIGDEGWETPLGTYRIIEKIVNPAWHVPESIREQKPELPRSRPPRTR